MTVGSHTYKRSSASHLSANSLICMGPCECRLHPAALMCQLWAAAFAGCIQVTQLYVQQCSLCVKGRKSVFLSCKKKRSIFPLKYRRRQLWWVEYVRYVRNDTKGLKHRWHLTQILLCSTSVALRWTHKRLIKSSICMVKNPHTYTYINIFAILSKSFLSAMFTTLYSIRHRFRTFNLCTQKRQRRSSLCSAHLFLKGWLLLYRVLSTDLFFHHKPEYRCRWHQSRDLCVSPKRRDFSITVGGSISYLWYDSCPLEMVSFCRRDHWLTHFGVNHTLHAKLYQNRFSIFDVQTSLWCLCICVYVYIWPRHCINVWLVQHIFYMVKPISRYCLHSSFYYAPWCHAVIFLFTHFIICEIMEKLYFGTVHLLGEKKMRWSIANVLVQKYMTIVLL